jgi:hypothetical protein
LETCTGDLLDSITRETTPKDRESQKNRAFIVCKQLPRVIENRAQGTMAGWQISGRNGQKIQAPLDFQGDFFA